MGGSLAGQLGFLALVLVPVVAVVLVAARRPGEAGAWWPAAAATACPVLSYVPVALDDGALGYTAAMALTLATYVLLAQTQLFVLRQRVRVHRATAWLDRATTALALVTVGYAVLLVPLDDPRAPLGALVYVARPACALTLLAFGVTGALLSRSTGDRRTRALLLAATLLALGDVLEVVLVLTRAGPPLLWYLTVTLRLSTWVMVVRAARAPAPTGERLDEDAPAVLLTPAAALVTSIVVIGVDQVHALPTPAIVAALATLGVVGVKVAVVFARITALNATRRQARTDDLTGLANRRAMVEALAPVDRGRAVALVLVDLDRFKAVNDTLGHAAGDELLQQVAARLLESVRPGDLVVRHGGDEFAVVLHGAGGDDAVAVADRVAAALAQPFDLSAGEVGVGASVGVCAVDRWCATSAELLRRADAAMYRAKAAGGGVVLHDPLRSTTPTTSAPATSRTG